MAWKIWYRDCYINDLWRWQMEQQENIHYRQVKWAKMKHLHIRKYKINTEKLEIKKKRKSVKLNVPWEISNIGKACQNLKGMFEKQVRNWLDWFLNLMSFKILTYFPFICSILQYWSNNICRGLPNREWYNLRICFGKTIVIAWRISVGDLEGN